jgi:hypothetical protein
VSVRPGDGDKRGWIGSSGTASVRYNVFNNAAILSINTRHGDQWRRPTNILDARILKLGAQL